MTAGALSRERSWFGFNLGSQRLNSKRMIVDCAIHGRSPPRDCSALEDAFEASRDNSAFVWIGLHEPTPAEFEAVQAEFNLHELAVEDAIKAHQRPKVEVYGDSLFIVLKTHSLLGPNQPIEFGEIEVFVGDRFLIAVRHAAAALHEFASVEQRPELLAHGPPAALHAIIDKVVDEYQPVILDLDSDIRDVRKEVFSASRANPAERIYRLKREVPLAVDEAMSPLPDDSIAWPADNMRSSTTRCFPTSATFTTICRLTTQVESFEELLTNVLTANLSGWCPPERGCAPHLRLGCDHRRADYDRWHLRDELRAHAGAFWVFGYPLVLFVIAASCFIVYVLQRRSAGCRTSPDGRFKDQSPLVDWSLKFPQLRRYVDLDAITH